jgi:hypothetical protein
MENYRISLADTKLRKEDIKGSMNYYNMLSDLGNLDATRTL